jgi:hypothetical protein
MKAESRRPPLKGKLMASTASASENESHDSRSDAFQYVVKKVREHGRKNMTLESTANDAQQDRQDRAQGMHLSEPKDRQYRKNVTEKELH